MQLRIYLKYTFCISFVYRIYNNKPKGILAKCFFLMYINDKPYQKLNTCIKQKYYILNFHTSSAIIHEAIIVVIRLFKWHTRPSVVDVCNLG